MRKYESKGIRDPIPQESAQAKFQVVVDYHDIKFVMTAMAPSAQPVTQSPLAADVSVICPDDLGGPGGPHEGKQGLRLRSRDAFGSLKGNSDVPRRPLCPPH